MKERLNLMKNLGNKKLGQIMYRSVHPYVEKFGY